MYSISIKCFSLATFVYLKQRKKTLNNIKETLVLPQQSRYIVRPILREHNQKETHGNQYNTSQFHSSKCGTIQDYIKCCGDNINKIN